MRWLTALAVCLSMGCSGQEAPERPNVVLILLDTFRPDHLGINGYSRQTAPFLEQLMERSTVFSEAFSTSSWTAPATGSLFTGLYPNRHGVTEGFMAHGGRSDLTGLIGEKIQLNRLPDAVATVPELFEGAGYSTFGVAANINIGSEIGFDRGFNRFRKLKDGAAEELADVLEGWRSEIDASHPYFVYLHFNDTHQPYARHEPWYQGGADERARSVSAYDSEISYLDGVLETLYRDFGWHQNTLLMVVSDHGEELGERGRFGHGFSLRQVLIRVLWVIAGPDLEIPARTVITPVSLIDVLPTLLDLTGLPQPEGLDGMSMASLLGPTPVEPASVPQRTLFAHRFQHRGKEAEGEAHLWTAIRMPLKLVVRPRSKPRLFDLSIKSRKRSNLAARKPTETAELLAALDSHQQASSVPGGEQVEVELDREMLENLKSLGYVQ